MDRMSEPAMPDARTPLRVRCHLCSHSWIAAYVPMELVLFVKLVKGLRCPMCAADSKSIFLPEGTEAADSSVQDKSIDV
ncbi:MAG: hypothetical protein Q8N51_00585 [Gammaproteobacteria bacterium]|nr:hypothetical protein [Gammaproteobacteria bacterium]